MTGSARTAGPLPLAAEAPLVTLRRGSGVASGSYAFTGRTPATGSLWHRHDLHQLEYAVEGVVELETVAARHRLPSRQAVWIPAGLPHRTSIARARTVSVFFDPALVHDGSGRVRVLPVEPILRAMIDYSARWPIGRPSSDGTADGFFETLALLVLELFAHERPYALPNTTDPVVAAVMRHTDAHLATVTAAEACRAAAISERTLRRRFPAATGMTWRQYLLHSRLLHAMALLSEREPTVIAVATAVGFDSASAFTRAFHAYTGQTPTAFRRERLPAVGGERRGSGVVGGGAVEPFA